MPQRRALNDDGSPETPDRASWDGGGEPMTEPAPVPAGEETGGDTSPDEGGGAKEEGPAARRTAFVEAIVADPANPPAVRLFAGWIGAAAEKGKTRIYLDLALGRWIDLPSGDVLHAAKEGPGRLARTLVWVRASPPALSGGAAGGEEGAEMQDAGPFHAP